MSTWQVNMWMWKKIYMPPLGVNNGGAHVIQASIWKAYRKWVLQIHPDKFKDEPLVATEEFLKLQKAYETLSDKEAQGTYDKL